MPIALQIIVDHQIVVGWWLVLTYMRIPPTHSFLESSGRASLHGKLTLRPIEDLREPMLVSNSILVTGRLVGGPRFEKMGVGRWHIQTLTHHIPLHLGWFVLIHTKMWWASGQHGNSLLYGHFCMFAVYATPTCGF